MPPAYVCNAPRDRVVERERERAREVHKSLVCPSLQHCTCMQPSMSPVAPVHVLHGMTVTHPHHAVLLCTQAEAWGHETARHHLYRTATENSTFRFSSLLTMSDKQFELLLRRDRYMHSYTPAIACGACVAQSCTMRCMPVLYVSHINAPCSVYVGRTGWRSSSGSARRRSAGRQ